MKNLIILLSLFAFSCTNIQAQECQIKCQSSEIHITPLKPQIVEVVFAIDATGKANVIEIHSDDLEMQQLVLNRLKNIRLEKDNAYIGKVLHYRFDFSNDEG